MIVYSDEAFDSCSVRLGTERAAFLYLTVKSVSEHEKHFSTKAARKQDMKIITQNKPRNIQACESKANHEK